ncbi:MAG: ABC transporter permease [Nitrospirae bacterium]|nr:MAG: ABC transporter permease [Nitrospirota bacterium]
MTIVVFSLLKTLPGDPATSLVGERATPETIAKIRNSIGADKSPIEQYWGYLKLLLSGDFGRSYFTNRDVGSDIAAKFPNTIKLAFSAMFIAVPAGLIIGFISARRNSKITSKASDIITLACLSIPVFWSAIIIMLIFSLKLKLLPPSGSGGLSFLILPAFVLSIPASATIARVTKTSVSDILQMPYITTAKAKGLTPYKINTVHIIKNALIPIVTIIGLDFGSYLNGAVVTETIFGWDGIGRFIMEGILKRDYPVIMGCIVVGTAVFMTVNLITDIAYHFLDPRIKLHGKDR